jgi:hypothetical protein
MRIPEPTILTLSARVVALALALLIAGCIPPAVRGLARDSSQSGTAPAEVPARLRWIRIYGAGNEASPPILRLPVKGSPASTLGSTALTISFDMQCQGLPNLTMILVHCDRDWQPTENMFVQDVIRLRSSDFAMERSPIGVKSYDYSISTTFPQAGQPLRIEYSGNYIARIVDYYDNAHVYGEARFIAVEPKAPVDLQVNQDFYESPQTEVVQHGLKVRVEADLPNDLFSSLVRGIALYRSGEWMNPMMASDESKVADRDAGDVWVDWSAFLGRQAVAQFANLPSGNEHRLLDLTDVMRYPSTGGMLTTPLSDLPRSGYNAYDNNGVALRQFVSLQDDDYVYFDFRLDPAEIRVKNDLFVVGTFTNWQALPEWRMTFDSLSGFYEARGWIKRALHEYQYVTGSWDEDRGILRHADATLLEGNTTSSSQLFYAFVYYHETAGGGYDRIIGVGAGGTSF